MSAVDASCSLWNVGGREGGGCTYGQLMAQVRVDDIVCGSMSKVKKTMVATICEPQKLVSKLGVIRHSSKQDTDLINDCFLSSSTIPFFFFVVIVLVPS